MRDCMQKLPVPDMQTALNMTDAELCSMHVARGGLLLELTLPEGLTCSKKSGVRFVTPNVKLGTRSRGTSTNSATSCTLDTRGQTPHSRRADMMPPLRQESLVCPNNYSRWLVRLISDVKFFARIDGPRPRPEPTSMSRSFKWSLG